jgi:Ca-activated chloride channel family protein
MQLSARFEHSLLAVETEQDVHCMLELTSPDAPGADTRTPLDLALVIDRSGSMAGRKLEVTKACAAYLARRLAPTDRIALVTYDDEVRLIAPLAEPTSALAPAIASIQDGGTTNLSGGWMKGLEVVGGADDRGAVRRILLLTDGLANVGVTDPKALVGMARRAAKQQRVGTTTIGFGEDFDEQLLTDMAEAGGGNGHFAASPDDAPGIFATEFDDLVSMVAQNVSVEVRVSEHVQVLGVLNEFPCVQVDGGIQAQLGDAYGGETRRVVFRLHVPSLPTLGPATIGEVVLRYVSVGRTTEQAIEQHETRIPLNVNLVSADEAAAAGLDTEVRDEVVILRSAKAQRDARERADHGDFDGAKTALRGAVEDLRSHAAGSTHAAELRRMADELEADLPMLEPDAFDAMSAKSMHYRMIQSKLRRIKHESIQPDDEDGEAGTGTASAS